MSRRQQATVNYLKCTVPVFAGRGSEKAQIFFSKNCVFNFTTIRLFHSRHGLEISSPHRVQTILGPIHPLIRCMLGSFFQWLNQKNPKAYHSLPNSFKVKNEWKYPLHTSHTSWRVQQQFYNFLTLTSAIECKPQQNRAVKLCAYILLLILNSHIRNNVNL
jgi:hypothetical protein